MNWCRKASNLCDRGSRRHPQRLRPGNGCWRRWVIALGVLCLLSALDRDAGAQTCPYNQTTASASFNFTQYTGSQPFTLNTCNTTTYGPAWANIVTNTASNFLPCQTPATTSIALCYYSGPDSGTVPCELAPDGATASCTCYVIPGGQKYSVDINAISNLDEYIATTDATACGVDGSACTGVNTAPVCTAINEGTLIPGATLISAFSTYLHDNDAALFPTGQTQCTTTPTPLYAGCMTAPCILTGTNDIAPPNGTGLPLAQCTCPTYSGPFQAGVPNQPECALGDTVGGTPLVWSASYTPGTTQQIAAIQIKLDSLVSSGHLTTGEAHSLGAKVEAAFESIQKHDNAAGKNILKAMLNEVSALLKSKRISSNTASSLSGAISNAIASL